MSADKNRRSYNPIFTVTVTALALIIVLCSVFCFVFDIYEWAFITTDWVKEIKANRYSELSVNAPKGCVVFLGDSLTEMYDLNSHYDFTTLNRGISGDVTSHMLERLHDNVIITQPEVLVLLGGANDLGHGGNPYSLTENLKKIILTVQQELPSCTVILQSLYPINPNVLAISRNIVGTRTKEDILLSNELIYKMCNDLDVQYVDMHSFIADDDGYMKKEFCIEGLHLNKRGYVTVTEVLEPYILEALNSKDNYIVNAA